MIRLSQTMIRVLVAVVVFAIVAVVAVYALTGSSGRKITAEFASGVGVYPGTPVKILGIDVGKVTKVTAHGDRVTVEMTYGSSHKIPANASAYLVANSLVSDRSVQISPAYTSGAVMADGATIPLQRTASPAELDDITRALNQLSVALGPQGANKNGALSALVNVGAANLQGNGKALGDSVRNLSQAVTTLSNGSGDLTSTVTNLRKFTDALNQSDSQVRSFDSLLAQVAGDLADERSDLGAALHNLGIALDEVSTFVKANQSAFHTDIVGLDQILGVLVKDKASLNEALVAGPIALSNLTHAYQESTGTLGTRSNLVNLTDPSLFPLQLCDLFTALTDQSSGLGLLLGGLTDLLGPLADAKTCKAIVTGSGLPATSSANDLSGLTNALTGGGS